MNFVHFLEGPNNLSALWNSEVSTFGSILKYCIIRTSIRTASSGEMVWENCVQKLMLLESILYLFKFSEEKI